MTNKLRLGVNIDHVATLRNARGEVHPEPLRAAVMAQEAGADSITVHLREDRRHIRDGDVKELKDTLTIPLNLEIAATEEMVGIALAVKPHACCIVPERREELTTEGGLDVVSGIDELKPHIAQLTEAGIRVSLFIDPDIAQLDAAKEAGAPVIELHTGQYCHASGAKQKEELARIVAAAAHAQHIGLECHAGHGLNYDNVIPVAAIPQIVELNIGHFLIGEAVFLGLKGSIAGMRMIMDKARKEAA